MSSPTITFAAATGAIDAASGVIRGVSVITEGPALGHGVMVDRTTLEQVKTAAERYEGGLKVKLDHNSSAGDIVGFIDGFRIEGKKLLGDLHLLETSPHRDYILEIAQRIPDTFGLSVAFSGPSELSADKKTVLQRCSEIYSCDVVSEPAANPTGFFSRKLKQLAAAEETETETDSPEIEIELPMNEETTKAIAGMIESAMMGLTERMAKLESAIAPAKPEEKPAAMSAANKEVVALAAKEAAQAALKEFASKFGAPAAPVVSAEPHSQKQEAKKFEALVADKAAELKGDKAAALTFCIKNHTAEYSAYRARVQAGEIIKL